MRQAVYVRNDVAAVFVLEVSKMTITRWWEAAVPPAEPVLIALKDIRSRVPAKSRTTIYRRIRQGRFPKPRLYIGNRAMWFQHEFEAWMQGKAG